MSLPVFMLDLLLCSSSVFVCAFHSTNPVALQYSLLPWP